MEGGGLWPIHNVTSGEVPDFNLQALMSEMERLFDHKLEPIKDRLYQVETRGQQERTPEDERHGRGHPNQNLEEYYKSSD